MREARTCWAFLVALAASAACGKETVETAPFETGANDANERPSGSFKRTLVKPSLDLLLVVDNSRPMGDKQRELARRIPSLVKSLTQPDLGGDTTTVSSRGVSASIVDACRYALAPPSLTTTDANGSWCYPTGPVALGTSCGIRSLGDATTKPGSDRTLVCTTPIGPIGI